MATPALTDAAAQQALDIWTRADKSWTRASEAMGISRGSLYNRVRAAQTRGLTPTPMRPFSVHRPPEELRPVEELLREREVKFDHLRRAKEAKRLIRVDVNISGPIGIAHFGDPHVDDDGTDIRMLRQHVDICNRTKGLFAANVGDTLNNWTGRLARLYGEQSTSAAEAWQLGEWFLKSTPWLYVLGGNHGAWSGAGDPVKWILKNCVDVFDNFQARLELNFPNGRKIRVNARHDFSGYSMWNAAHGVAKAAKMGWRDHVLTCGHTHQSGYQIEKDPATGLISHCLRVASYKTFDRYAHEKGLPQQDAFCNVVTVIDPRWPDDDPRLIQPLFHVESGADYLTWLRSRK